MNKTWWIVTIVLVVLAAAIGVAIAVACGSDADTAAGAAAAAAALAAAGAKADAKRRQTAKNAASAKDEAAVVASDVKKDQTDVANAGNTVEDMDVDEKINLGNSLFDPKDGE